MATKKNLEKQELNNSELFKKVKENGTITLNDLMEELAKTGVKDIHFEDVCFNLEKASLDKVDKTPFEENVDEIMSSDLLKNPDLAEVDNVENINKDIQLLDCIMDGSFEADDIERLLSLMDIEVIRNYVLDKIKNNSLNLRTYVYLLMDLRGR